MKLAKKSRFFVKHRNRKEVKSPMIEGVESIGVSVTPGMVEESRGEKLDADNTCGALFQQILMDVTKSCEECADDSKEDFSTLSGTAESHSLQADRMPILCTCFSACCELGINDSLPEGLPSEGMGASGIRTATETSSTVYDLPPAKNPAGLPSKSSASSGVADIGIHFECCSNPVDVSGGVDAIVASRPEDFKTADLRVVSVLGRASKTSSASEETAVGHNFSQAASVVQRSAETDAVPKDAEALVSDLRSGKLEPGAPHTRMTGMMPGSDLNVSNSFSGVKPDSDGLVKFNQHNTEIPGRFVLSEVVLPEKEASARVNDGTPANHLAVEIQEDISGDVSDNQILTLEDEQEQTMSKIGLGKDLRTNLASFHTINEEKTVSNRGLEKNGPISQDSELRSSSDVSQKTSWVAQLQHTDVSLSDSIPFSTDEPVEAIDKKSLLGSKDNPPQAQVSVLSSAKPAHHVSESTNVALANALQSDANLAEKVVGQIVKAVSLRRLGGQSEILVKLHPPELGFLTIRIAQDVRGLVSHIETTREEVRNLLQAHLPILTDALSESGVRLNSVTVSYESSLGDFHHNFGQDWGDSQQRGFYSHTSKRQHSYSHIPTAPQWSDSISGQEMMPGSVYVSNHNWFA